MDWREALRARATGLASGRVYWTERKQGDPLPAVVLLSVGDDRPQHFKGFSLAPGRVQIDAYGTRQQQAWDLAEEALTTLVPGASSNGHNFSRADVALGPRDLTERVGNETIFRVSMDLIFHHATIEEES
jgi:hypothetical protein